MEYLHKHKEEFINAVNLASEYFHILPVHSYIGDMMIEEAPEEIKNFRLDPFEMKVQGLDRTLVDKVFAICDYYMQDRVKNIHGIFMTFINYFQSFRKMRNSKILLKMYVVSGQ